MPFHLILRQIVILKSEIGLLQMSTWTEFYIVRIALHFRSECLEYRFLGYMHTKCSGTKVISNAKNKQSDIYKADFESIIFTAVLVRGANKNT